MTEVIQTAQRIRSRRGRVARDPERRRTDAGHRWAADPSFEQTPDGLPRASPGLRGLASQLPGAFASGRFSAHGPCVLRSNEASSRLKTGTEGSGVCDSRNRMAASPTPTPRTGQDELLVWASGRERGGAGDRGSAVPGGGCGCTPSSDPHLSTFSKQDPQHRSQVIGVGHRDA